MDNARSFLGSAGHDLSFTNDYTACVYPLTQLLKKDVPFQCSKDLESIFKIMQHAFTHASILIFPNYKDPFLFQTDARMLGIEAALMLMDNTGKMPLIVLPVVFCYHLKRIIVSH